MPAEPTTTGILPGWAARHPLALLTALCLLLWLPGVLSLPPLDRDESRFAQSSKQMLETGDFVDIRLGLVPRYKKPVGIYWAQAATTAIAGLGDHTHVWSYRLASLIGGILAVWAVWWMASAFLPPAGALAAGAILGASLLLTAESTIATTDAALLAALAGVHGVLLRAYLAVRTPGAPPVPLWLALAGWAMLGVAVLIKGPLALLPLLTGLTLWAADREARWLGQLRPLWGVPVLAAVVAPWIAAIAIQTHGVFFQQSLGGDFASKLTEAQETHGGPPGYYLVLTTLTFWPGILFLAPAIGVAVLRRAEAAPRFLLAWIVPAWLVFEAAPTKLPHYILPVFPALAILVALYLSPPPSSPSSQRRPAWLVALSGVGVAQFVLGLAGFAAAPIVLTRLYGAGAPLFLYGLAGLGTLAGLTALALRLRGRACRAVAASLAAVLVFYPLLTLGAAPRLTQLWLSPRAAAAAQAHARPGDPPPILAGYQEPSLVFLLGTDTRLTGGAMAAETAASQGGLVLVEDAERPAFLARLEDLEAGAAAVDVVSGLNYSRGRRAHITLYRVMAERQFTVPPAE